MEFKNVTVIKEANVYFDGKVTSRTVLFESGEKKTLGIMLAGEYEFNTDAEEIMEDTFVWLWNNRSTLEEAESVKPLLFLRAKHYLINAYRKVINSPVYEDYMDYLDHHNSTAADSQLEYDDFVRQLNLMLAKLPKTQQEIIRLSKLEMLNNQEIAEKLNYSEQTVKNQLSMGLKQLRQLISNRTNLMWLLFLV